LKVVVSGIALTKVRPDEFGDVVVSCGVAGGLRADVPTGSVVIPENIGVAGAPTTACDVRLTETLVAAARRLGHEPLRGALLTSAALISGETRSAWARAGYVAADMETGFIRARRIAAVRVVLDTPRRELSGAWLRPQSVILRPSLWGQGLWLARNAPRCASIAAEIAAAAFANGDGF
jgi:hypothetical protein